LSMMGAPKSQRSRKSKEKKMTVRFPDKSVRAKPEMRKTKDGLQRRATAMCLKQVPNREHGKRRESAQGL